MATANSENCGMEFSTINYSFPTEPIPRLDVKDPKADQLIREGVSILIIH